jgi:hypothetical protein
MTGLLNTNESRYAHSYGHVGATYGWDSIMSYHPELNLSIAVASNIERQLQEHPAETLCLVYNRLRGLITHPKWAPANCSYESSGYYGGTCTCSDAV